MVQFSLQLVLQWRCPLLEIILKEKWPIRICVLLHFCGGNQRVTLSCSLFDMGWLSIELVDCSFLYFNFQNELWFGVHFGPAFPFLLTMVCVAFLFRQKPLAISLKQRGARGASRVFATARKPFGVRNLTVTHIAVSLTFKWEVALRETTAKFD